VAECLGYLPEHIGPDAPIIRFDNSESDLSRRGARKVASEIRAVVARQFEEAYTWCESRLPLTIRACDSEGMRKSITSVMIGHSEESNVFLSSSSPEAPGVVFIAADWPMKNPYRLASLIAHEGIHQALYQRESEISPVTSSSVGYSPWKKTLRPGRWVWHAFWTFCCQSVMLGESVQRDPSLLQYDRSLLRFVADLMARVSVNLASLELFRIVSSEELTRCDRAFTALERVAGGLDGGSDFAAFRAAAHENALQDMSAWADHQSALLTTKSGDTGAG